MLNRININDNFNKNNIEMETFLSLFTDTNFNNGYIDVFSSKSMNLLYDSSVPKSMKDGIIGDQEEFKKIIDSLGLKIENLTTIMLMN